MQESNAAREFMGCDVWVPAAIDEVWAYFSEPNNLEKLTPASYGAKIYTRGPTANDCEVEISLAPFGIPVPLKWVSKISEGVGEIEGALSGHKLVLEPRGTWVRDRIEYPMPLGSIGKIAHTLVAKKNLIQLLAFRRQKLVDLFKK